MATKEYNYGAKTKGLRFATVERVSGSGQENKDKDAMQSLNLQRESNTDAVTQLEGKIVKHYRGSESATDPDRIMFAQIMNDAEAGLFDAVMVENENRWSKNAENIGQCVDTFLCAGVRLFFNSGEMNLKDLFGVAHRKVTAIYAQTTAWDNAIRGFKLKIKYAQLGWPGKGKDDFKQASLPFARGWNPAEKDNEVRGWYTIPELVEKAQEAWDMLANKGQTLAAVVDRFGGSELAWRERLSRKNAGGTWTRIFKPDKLKGHVETTTVQIKIPRLLSEEQITALENRPVKRGGNRAKTAEYLLSGHVRCFKCGTHLLGSCPKPGYRYYMHGYKDRKSRDRCFTHIKADVLEGEIFKAIMHILKDEKTFWDAVKKSSSSDKQAEHQKRLDQLDRQLREIKKKKSNLAVALADEKFDITEVKELHGQLTIREKELELERIKVAQMIHDAPSQDQVEQAYKIFKRRFLKGKLTSAEKQELFKQLFRGFGTINYNLPKYKKTGLSKRGVWVGVNGGGKLDYMIEATIGGMVEHLHGTLKNGKTCWGPVLCDDITFKEVLKRDTRT